MSVALFFGELWEGIQLVLGRSVDILEQPFLGTDMLWILLPLLATLFLIELYFGRYRKETLGWTSAVGNSLVLFFVAVNLFSYLYRSNLLISVSLIDPNMISIAVIKSIITFFILLESILLIVLNFFHLMPKNLAFGISSALMINFIGVIAIIHVYSETLPFDIIALLASLVIFIGLAVVFKGLQLMMPKASEEEKKAEAEDDEE